MRGKVFSWLKSYLTNRNHLVLMNGATSGKLSLSFGVSQGSCLGPFLFDVYASKLFDLIWVTYLKFTVLMMTLGYICHLNLVMPKHRTKRLQLWRIVYVILEHGCFEINWSLNDDKTQVILTSCAVPPSLISKISDVSEIFRPGKSPNFGAYFYKPTGLL